MKREISLVGIATIILAAGKGTRMKSDLVKVLHPILGLPMLSYSIELSLNEVKAKKTIVVVGHQADRIQEMFRNPRVDFVLQKEQLGTGHAVLQALPFLQSFVGTVLILCGDVPLVKVETLRSFIDSYEKNESALSVLTAVVEEPFGYGRILRNPEGWLEKIVEEKDSSEKQRKIREINTGIFCVNARFLKEGLKEIGKENAQARVAPEFSRATQDIDRTLAGVEQNAGFFKRNHIRSIHIAGADIPDCSFAHSAGELRRHLRIVHRTRVERIEQRPENVAPLLKERSSLRIHQ